MGDDGQLARESNLGSIYSIDRPSAGSHKSGGFTGGERTRGHPALMKGGTLPLGSECFYLVFADSVIACLEDPNGSLAGSNGSYPM